MQHHDKACYRAPCTSSTPAPSGKTLRRRYTGGGGGGNSRPSSGMRRGNSLESVTSGYGDWDDAVPDPSQHAGGESEFGTDRGAAKASSSSSAAASAAVSYKAPPPPVLVDYAAKEAEYYQKSLPPKRPGVPRSNPHADHHAPGTVSKAQQQKLEVSR
jgi:hypothetical protein